MRFESGHDLLHAATLADDGIYPSKSPTPAPKMCACVPKHDPKAESQRLRCDRLDYIFSQGFCRAPDTWRMYCPNAEEHKRNAHVPQKQKMVHTDIPRGVSVSGSRRERRFARVQGWVRLRLQAWADDDRAAAIILGLDETMSHEEYEALADRIWKEYEQLPRHLK